MSKIDVHNYEAYLLDYLEGCLDTGEIVELQEFLAANPGFNINLDEPLPVIASEELTVEFKPDLHRFLTPQEELVCSYLEHLMSPSEKLAFESRILAEPALAAEVEKYKLTFLAAEDHLVSRECLYKTEIALLSDPAIRYVEDLMDVQEKTSFEANLRKNELLAGEVNLYKKTILVPGETIFPGKHSLYKEAKVVRLFTLRRAAAAAAAIIFTTIVFYMLKEKSVNDTLPVAVKDFSKPVPAIKAREFVEKPVTANIPSGKSQNEIALKKQRKPVPTFSPVARESEQPVESVTVQEIVEAPQDSIVKTIKAPEPLLAEIPDADTIHPGLAQLPVVELSQDEFFMDDASAFGEFEEQVPRRSFWQRITMLAGEASKLGIKGVEGEIIDDGGFRLSINSFSVEKK